MEEFGGAVAPDPGGLHLAASASAVKDIRASAKNLLQQDDVEAMLNGIDVSNWPAVARTVLYIEGRPSQIRLVWDAARAAALHREPSP
ncbi:hypothetical protein OHB25_59345 [Streptomyces mirabilis]|uniref:hypothetical protein n=1 Tax=Streptomyces mirabilis TaxID=68239 RepID=UPI002E1D78FD